MLLQSLSYCVLKSSNLPLLVPTNITVPCFQISAPSCPIRLFPKNRFVIMPTEGVYFDIPEKLPERLEASIFLRDVVPRNMLSCLWSLELVFPPIDLNYILLGSPAYHGWVKTISYVHEQLSSHRGVLTCLRTYFSEFPTKEENIQPILPVCERILSPLSRLGGNGLISRCFVFTS